MVRNVLSKIINHYFRPRKVNSSQVWDSFSITNDEEDVIPSLRLSQENLHLQHAKKWYCEKNTYSSSVSVNRSAHQNGRKINEKNQTQKITNMFDSSHLNSSQNLPCITEGQKKELMKSRKKIQKKLKKGNSN